VLRCLCLDLDYESHFLNVSLCLSLRRLICAALYLRHFHLYCSMMQFLVFNAKVRLAKCFDAEGQGSCDLYNSRVDILDLLVNANCRDIPAMQELTKMDSLRYDFVRTPARFCGCRVLLWLPSASACAQLYRLLFDHYIEGVYETGSSRTSDLRWPWKCPLRAASTHLVRGQHGALPASSLEISWRLETNSADV